MRILTKACKWCHKDLPLSAFYKHSMMADGHLNRCKACVRQYQKENSETIKEYDRKRGDLPHRLEANRNRYRAAMSDPVLKQRMWDKKKAWTAKNMEKRAAHVMVGNAIRDGSLVKGPCGVCATTDDIQAHHEDYSKPMEVVWLCRPCHCKRHKQLNEERRKSEAA